MSYRLEPTEKLSDGIKRIATEQVDQALDQLTTAPEGPNEAVHDARKRFKKIRAVLRLVRDEVGEDFYQKENVCYRDAGRVLSDVRDSYVMVETVEDLNDRFAGQLSDDAFSNIRDRLMEEHQAFKQKILEEEKAMEQVAETIRAARTRIDDWPISHEDFSAVHDGLERVYKRGYKRMAEAYADPSPERFHEWRKRVKYLWYHTRILRPMWDDVLDEVADEVHDLSDYLGDGHDLAELRTVLLERADGFEDEKEFKTLIALVDRRYNELMAAAYPLGQKIYAEKPEDFMNRMADYWQAWQTDLAQPPVPVVA